jgi:ABC-type spermidine/putrescine transport system, permease component II
VKRQRKIAMMKTTSAVYSSLIYLFLYLPIIVIIVFSFNTSKRNIVFEGFTFEWYSTLFQNTALLKAFGNTMIVALVSTLLASIIGTFAAIGMDRYRFKGKGAIDALLYVPVVIPEIVLGIALLGVFSMAQVPLGLLSLIIAHTTFCIPFVVFTLRARLAGYDKSVEEAAMDLGANRRRVFFHITLPILFPGVLSGAMLAFTLSIDDVIISYFTNGPASTTYPLKVWELVKSGVSPDVNALSTLIILGTLVFVVLTQSRNFKSVNKKVLNHKGGYIL